MSISPLLSNGANGLTGNGTTATHTSGGLSGISQALAKAEQRVQADANSTTAQLSSFGLLKSAVSASQGSAKALAETASSASSTVITKSVENFYRSFNSAIAASKAASMLPGSSPASQSARRVSSDLKHVLSTDPAAKSAMSLLGLSIGIDGVLIHNDKKLAASLASNHAGVLSALKELGNKVSDIATQELATGGGVGAGLTTLNQRESRLAAQQQAIRAAETALASANDTNTDIGSGVVMSAAAAGPAPTILPSQAKTGLAAYHSNATAV